MAAVEITNYVAAIVAFTAANPPVLVAASGANATVVRNGAGDYTVTLDNPIATADHFVRATRTGAGDTNVNAQRDAANTNEVDVFAFNAAGAAADIAETVLVEVLRYPEVG